MPRHIYVNLPVKNLDASIAFFRSLGFDFNAQFTGPTGACMIISDVSYVMLLQEEFFKSFTPHPICDAKKSTEVLVCLSCASRREVDDLVRQAVAVGGATYKDPNEHGGMMYGHGFQDLDGHIWELVHMLPPPGEK
jgi:uncharacterized protein